MGPVADLRCLQPGRGCLLCYLLLPLSGPVTKAHEIRHLVSCHTSLLCRAGEARIAPQALSWAAEEGTPTPWHIHPTHGVVPSGLLVLMGNKPVFLQLPVVHRLSISHDIPDVPTLCPVTGEGDLQGTSAFASYQTCPQPCICVFLPLPNLNTASTR